LASVQPPNHLSNSYILAQIFFFVNCQIKFDQLENLCYRKVMNVITPIPTLDVAAYLDAPDRLSAGKLCLEFANTADWHSSEQPIETITAYTDLVDWAVRVGIRSGESAQELRTQAATHPALAEQVYHWAIDLREAIYRIFATIAAQESPDAVDLALLNEALPHAFALPEIIATDNGYGWRWRGDESGLDTVLWPILRSAARLLTEGEHNRIGECADDRGCGYLFYDTSRNRSRRWCDMNSCGNRAKSQRHYARHRNN
jgi:predicted RNA-binding Zn ribbon-like protein